MRKYLFHALFLSFAFLMAETTLTSCASRNHCPAVAGTGNSATHKGGFRGKKGCAGVTGTGNAKPKVRKKKEDGLTSRKMEKQIAKAERKKAGPIKSKTLSADK